MNTFKKIINVLAWIALPAMAIGYLTPRKLCLDISCANLISYSLIPLGFLILCINSIIKKDYQVSIVLLIMTVLSIYSVVDLYERHTRPIPAAPAVPYKLIQQP